MRSRLLALDVLRLGTLGLRARRLRVALSCLGIAIGVAAVIGVMGISASSTAGLLDQIGRLGNRLTVTPGQTVFGANAELPRPAVAMIARLGGVREVSAVGATSTSVRRTDLIPAGETLGLSVLAARTDLLGVLQAHVVQGEFLNPATASEPAVVLGSAAASRLGVDRTGVRVWLDGHWFVVVGILDAVPLAPEIDRAALVGFPAAERLLRFDGAPTTIYVQADPDTVDAVRDLLARAANPEHPDEVQVSRPSDSLAALAAARTASSALLAGLGLLALLVGGVGIANVMVVSVLERRAEIGVRRALGARRLHVGLQFLAEAVLLSTLGGLAGMLLGAGVTAAYDVSQALPLVVPPIAFAAALIAAALAGGVAGIYPALRAAALAPTEALRAG
jgi:putative ABC transport system permease protein